MAMESLRFPHLSTAEYAEFGLECYKKERGPEHTDYKVVRALSSCRVLANALDVETLGLMDWCHVSFFASRKYDGDDAKQVLFFVELVDYGYGDGLVLNNYSILKLDSPEITYGCGFCPPDVEHPHPRGAYFAGEWDYKPTNDTSQKEMAICFEEKIIDGRKDKMNTHFNLKCGLPFKPEPFDDVVLDPSLRCPHLSTVEYAELALECYRKERRTMLIAIPRYSNCSDDEVLFFAELVDFGYGDQLVLNCFSITKLDAPGITYGCGLCPPGEDHPHPRGAYYGGRWDYKPTNDTYQYELAASFQLQVIYNRKKNPNSHLSREQLLPDPVEPDPSFFSPVLSDYEYAKLALSYISKAEEIEYELAQTLYSHRQKFLLGSDGYGHWCHVGFSAEPKNGDGPIVHFFAELNDPGVRKFNLCDYSRLDLSSVETKKGCQMCPVSEKYPHPTTASYVDSSPHTVCFEADYVHCEWCSNTDKLMGGGDSGSSDEDFFVCMD